MVQTRQNATTNCAGGTKYGHKEWHHLLKRKCNNNWKFEVFSPKNTIPHAKLGVRKTQLLSATLITHRNLTTT